MMDEIKNENTETDKKNIKINKKLKLTILCAVLAIICCVVGYIFYEVTFYQTTDDAYVETTTVSVAPKVAGEIIEVYVKDNQQVKAGDVIAKIDPIDYEVRLAQAEAAYQRKISDQKNAQAALTAANSEIELAKRDVERYTNLYTAGAVSKQTLDNAKTKYEAIKANQTRAQQNIFSDGKSVADADLKSLKAQRDIAALNLSYTTIRAPQDGTVASKRVQKGMMVAAGSPLFTLVPDEVWIVANFKETQLEKMRPGQHVSIKVDTYPHHTFKGKVDSIQRSSGAKTSLFPPENAVGSFVKIVQRIPVKIVFTEKIDTGKYAIVPGMSVVPKVRIK